MRFRPTKRPGAITTILVLAVTGIVISAFVSLSIISTSQVIQVTDTQDGDQVFYAAEAGINQGLFRLSTSPGGQTITTTINGATVVITITVDTTDPLGQRRIVTSEGTLNGKKRTLQVTATTNAIASNFAYAVQSGNGGVTLGNGAQIRGNLHANGAVTGGNNSLVIGELSVAGNGSVSGIDFGAASDPGSSTQCPNPPADPAANAHELRSSSISNVRFYGTALYRTVTGNTVRDISVNPNDVCALDENGTNCKDIDVAGGTDPSSTPYPITQAQIDEFKNQADNTTSGSVTVNNNQTLTIGPVKINGNLSLGNNSILILGGPVWVSGTFSVGNNSVIRLDASAGEASGTIMFDQPITVSQNVTFQGSGHAKSAMLVIDFGNTAGIPAIQGSNNSSSVIFFAPSEPDGVIQISPSAYLNNTTGYRIVLGNTSCVQFNPNLTSFFIPNGPPVPVGVVSGSWKDL